MFARTTNMVVTDGENVVIDNCLLANAGQTGVSLTVLFSLVYFMFPRSSRLFTLFSLFFAFVYLVCFLMGFFIRYNFVLTFLIKIEYSGF